MRFINSISKNKIYSLENSKRIEELLETLVKLQISPILQQELNDPQRKKLYDLTGENMSVKQIAAKVGFSVGKISSMWQDWETKGLLVKNGKSYKKII